MLVALAPLRALAHGDDQLLIDALTEELAKSPDADRFIRRGELFRHHQEWAKAEADFLAAARLGPVVSLVDYAITLELDRQNYPRALERIATAMERAPRRENWLVRQGDVLVKLGRTREAVSSYRAALDAIAVLPPRHRETVPMEKLARDARTSLSQISSK